MAEPKKEQERKVVKRGETKCPHCDDQIYTHRRTADKDPAGHEIMVCTNCFGEYALEV
jgi:DNA-directed RNA polymerase subunit M/transcription elongation factor TFIIS